MKKILLLTFILGVILPTMAFASSARWQALGNEQRFIIDTSNYGNYPARLHQFGNAVWLMPRSAFGDNDIAAGILLKLNENMTGAFHFNLPPSSGVTKLGTALKSYGPVGENAATNPRLAALDPKVFPDLFWAMKSGSTSIGARIALAMDKSSVSVPKEISTSAMAIDAKFGVTMATGMGDVDLGVGAGIQSFSDDDGSKVTESTGGYLVSIDARLSKPKGKAYTIVPILSATIGADPTEKDKTEVSYMGGDVGVGLRTMFDKKMVLAGLVMAYNSVTKTPPTGAEVKETTLSPKFVAGCEAPLTKWLVVRGGASATLASKSNDVGSLDVNNYYNAGIRISYGGFIVDWILSRDLFHRGPFFVSGASSENNKLATNVCITYAF